MFFNLQDLMNRAGLTQTELAKISEMSFTSIHFRFNNTCDWKLREMLLIQKAINHKLGSNYTLDYIFKKE